MNSHIDFAKVAKYVAALAGINWGLVGVGYFLNTEDVFVNLNIVNLIFSNDAFPWMEAVVYIIIGLLSICALMQTYKSNKNISNNDDKSDR